MMRSRHIPRPVGNDAESEFHRYQAQRTQQELRGKNTPNAKFSQTTQGIAVKVTPPRSAGTTGWDWANPKTYDFNNSFTKNKIVVVLPGSFAVTDGLPSNDYDDHRTKKALPGIWIALQSVTVEGEEEDALYHVPQWPPPGGEDPDSEDNYWWPISLYAQLLTDCLGDGTEVSRYFNEADKPTEPPP